MFCREHIFFGWCIIFEMVNPLSIFCSVWPLSIIQRTCSTWNLFVHLCLFCTQVKFYDCVRDRISDCMHNRTKGLFGRSRVWTPRLTHDLFLWVRGLNPCPCSTIFLWVQGSVPWPWSSVLGPVYPWPTSGFWTTKLWPKANGRTNRGEKYCVRHVWTCETWCQF